MPKIKKLVEKKDLIYANAIEDLIKEICSQRNLNPNDCLIRIGVDGGQGSVKVVMNIFRDVQKQIKKFPLGQSVDEFKSFLRDILSPGVSESRDIIDRSVAPASGTTAPRVELPSGITGASVNPQVVAAGQPVQTAGIMSGQQLLGFMLMWWCWMCKSPAPTV